MRAGSDYKTRHVQTVTSQNASLSALFFFFIIKAVTYKFSINEEVGLFSHRFQQSQTFPKPKGSPAAGHWTEAVLRHFCIGLTFQTFIFYSIYSL